MPKRAVENSGDSAMGTPSWPIEPSLSACAMSGDFEKRKDVKCTVRRSWCRQAGCLKWGTEGHGLRDVVTIVCRPLAVGVSVHTVRSGGVGVGRKRKEGMKRGQRGSGDLLTTAMAVTRKER